MPTTDLPTLGFRNGDEFICNYCHCSAPGYPIILGQSARLACDQCASAIVKLSICWVCGEMICRGDDCISFGWCFWHRACFSCLLCGSRAVLSTSCSWALGTKAEVLRPPLCAACDMETARDTNEHCDSGLIQACVDFVDSVDGGMAKRRRQLMNDSSCSTWGSEKNPCLKLRAGRECDSDMRAQAQEQDWEGEPRELIWIDIVDPLNGPVFQPHPLKPVPTLLLLADRQKHYRLRGVDERALLWTQKNKIKNQPQKSWACRNLIISEDPAGRIFTSRLLHAYIVQYYEHTH
ncbi:hypothetical protein CCM_02815 [Cordyceps militaris CM01]|uniref:Uncharacterized protein n=1 Tax=Cordyceps militaris (strain CM01) TaxID=983644 RepID=G3JC29_CORMM|nr:uncharacterized protein CCM_02815 [Cordyceps militaris CM01]EGX94544.1 hypothetical protein CCM_02815 [Cordyceps militaris CM01]